MYLKHILTILIITVFSNLFVSSSIHAQTERDKQISKYIFDLGMYLRWENDFDIEVINVGVLNGSDSFLKELKHITRNGYDRQIMIKIIEFNSVADITETHILFIPKKENKNIKAINSKIINYNTALLSEEHSEKKEIMINVIRTGQKYNLEINPANLKLANVNYDPNIESLGCIFISSTQLFNESEKNLQRERRKVKNQEFMLNKQQSLIEKKNLSLKQQEAEIELQRDKLLSQANDIEKQEKRIKQQQAKLAGIQENFNKIRAELDLKTKDLVKKENEIADKEEEIVKKEEVIKKNIQILENQQNELREGQAKIDKMNIEIATQSGTILIYKNIVSIGVIILLIFLVMLFFILRGSRIRLKKNKQLAKQKEEIEEKTIELEAINIELEKLSIVASKTSNAVIILETNGEFEWVNEGFTRMYGHTLETLLANGENYIYQVSKKSNIKELISQCVNTKEHIIYESIVNTKSGDNKWAQTTLTPIINDNGEVVRLVLIDSDISQIKEAEREIIRQSEHISKQSHELELKNIELEQLSLVASKTDNSVIIAAPNGDIEWVNDGFTRLLGTSFEEFSQNYGSNLFSASLNPNLKEHLAESVKERRSMIYSAKTITNNGKSLWIQTTLTPIFDNQNNIIKYIAIDSDITKIKEAEIEIKKQKEKITDSIVYAQTIQRAVLPPQDYIDSLLSENFIIFKPKDIVSGDFYWAAQKGNKVIIAAVDCTGHGVPGGFMSMLGITFLNEITAQIPENELTAGKILTNLRAGITTSLRQTGKSGESKDGMDMALCVIDKEDKKLQFAGAFNPLFIVRHHGKEIEIINVMPDEMPIGIHFNMKNDFSNKIVDLQDDDLCYIFTDGFPDQFGGKNRSKFMITRFKNMLATYSDRPMHEQKVAIDKIFDKWRGKNRQIDDVLVIGFKPLK